MERADDVQPRRLRKTAREPFLNAPLNVIHPGALRRGSVFEPRTFGRKRRSRRNKRCRAEGDTHKSSRSRRAVSWPSPSSRLDPTHVLRAPQVANFGASHQGHHSAHCESALGSSANLLPEAAPSCPTAEAHKSATFEVQLRRAERLPRESTRSTRRVLGTRVVSKDRGAVPRRRLGPRRSSTSNSELGQLTRQAPECILDIAQR
jgi:hypothetical protein